MATLSFSFSLMHLRAMSDVRRALVSAYGNGLRRNCATRYTAHPAIPEKLQRTQRVNSCGTCIALAALSTAATGTVKTAPSIARNDRAHGANGSSTIRA
jgi:hypothetical protein